MAYASKAGRARTRIGSQSSQAVCDRCGIWYSIDALRFQYDWRGTALVNIRFLVCQECYDTPQEQLRAIVIPADPLPTVNARVEYFTRDETNYRVISQPTVYDPITGIPIPGTTVLNSEDGQAMTTQPVGPPIGLEQPAIQPLYGKVHYGQQIPVLSVISNGTDQITATCYAPHGLVTGATISAEGLTNNEADGFYSITVTTATAFTWQANVAIPSASLLRGTSNIVNAFVGIPLGYTQIPQTGI